METCKLLIADGTEEFRLALQAALPGSYEILSCTGGKEALALLQTDAPDIMVLDLMLPELDGISLLQAAAAYGRMPIVLATTRFVNDYVLESLDQLNVAYLMVKPCDVQATVSRILDLSQRVHPRADGLREPQSQAADLLLRLNIPTKLKGFSYLREAIPLMVTDPSQSITKELYPEVARICGSRATHVERSIRSAIESAWSIRNAVIWEQYFPSGSGGSPRRPTNAAFITRLADCLRR